MKCHLKGDVIATAVEELEGSSRTVAVIERGAGAFSASRNVPPLAKTTSR